ncbi:MAG: LemA family protein [Methanobrevibacter sp.]|uniref:LemA family protein n=1 Tax=Methanobrevibacter sp. TaxID=66852 RepID=UPI0025F9D182|nr:LemA family protein [Methanobrevibacter sp.]MBR0271827.1 LemA family protein [Methanobrevibacter sp.]
MSWILLIVVILVIIFLVVTIVHMYNQLVNLRNRVKNSFAQIDVQLKRRNDLIPNLVETVKGYAGHEKGVLEEVTKARGNVINASGVKETSQADNQLTGALKSLFAVAENYPDLKANSNFQQLQSELSDTENKISYARQFYNDTVLMYNNKCQQFPSSMLAKLFGFKEEDFFEAGEESREVPKVEF